MPYIINLRLSKYFVTFETTIWRLWELGFSRDFPVREDSPSDVSGSLVDLATTTVHDKHVSRSSNSKTQADSAVHYQNSDTRAERLPKEKYELQNEEELSVAMVRKKTWVALTVTRTKESRPYGYVVMITPLDITVGRTRILMTTELNNLPLLINEYCA